MELSESQTCSLLINPQLLAAGWKLSDRTQVRFEVPVAGYDPTPWNGITDFCLYQPSGPVLSVVEAKRASRNPREGEEQLRQYITEIARKQDFAPFGFMGNGLNTWFWQVGLAHPRLVANFFSPADLERLLFIRQNRQPLASIGISTAIVDRAYQHDLPAMTPDRRLVRPILRGAFLGLEIGTSESTLPVVGGRFRSTPHIALSGAVLALRASDYNGWPRRWVPGGRRDWRPGRTCRIPM